MLSAMVLAFVAGVLSWTLLEYVIHRFLGHGRSKDNPFALEHIRHHVEGDYFAPTWKKFVAGAIVGALLWGPAVWALGMPAGASYVSGLIGFYGVYELVHRRAHVSAGFGPYGRWLRRHHFSHHFTDARKNHGVTSPLWDFVFGTYRAPKVIAVPRKLCLPWLLDPATGRVRDEWSSVFVLR